MDEELRWVRIQGRQGTGDFIVGVCYSLLQADQEDQAAEALYRKREVTLPSQTLVFTGYFNHKSVC